jgi:tRNA/rRNA methyltransferase
MKNMGLRDLVLVAPRTRIGAVGERMAAHARDVLAARRVVPDLRAALRDCRLVVGTVGREVDPRGRIASPRSLAPEVLAAARGARVALVFGPEDHGLSNRELDLCQRWLRIPTGDDYASLNLAQAVLVCAYELLLAAAEPSGPANEQGAVGSPATRVSSAGVATIRRARREAVQSGASSAEREAMLEHLARALGEVGFLSAQNPEHILRDVRSLFARAGLTRRDAQIWRGIARQVLWAAGRARGHGAARLRGESPRGAARRKPRASL